MRRDRNLREYREKVLRERHKNLYSRATKNSFRNRLKKTIPFQPKQDFSLLPSSTILPFSGFVSYKDYIFSKRPIVVCHVIESLGLGGAQTMMLELINGLNKYYGSFSKNLCVYLNRKDVDKIIYTSYGVNIDRVKCEDLKNFCKNNSVDIVVQHRIAASKCIKLYIPDNVKYILINHTWHNMNRMSNFVKCDAYVSVCKFIHDNTKFPEFVHNSRKFTILNGVENDYIKDIVTYDLQGTFKTGRCHRLVPGKFQLDSLQWMRTSVLRSLPGFSHYIIGDSKEVKSLSKKHSFIHYMGSITDRYKKMSIIKGLDVYFYETFQNEGASVAILESLSSGVPVLCKSLGGCPELIKNGVNGFIVKNRSEYLIRLQQLYNLKYRNDMKKRVIEDFENRLHIKHTACNYMQLFEVLVNADIANN